MWWFWGQTGNRTYWQEKADLNNNMNLTELYPDLYSLAEWTLSGDIYTEHRVYKSSSEIMKKYSIHIGKGITTEYELKYNETANISDTLAYHHIKFSLITDVEPTDSTTTDENTTSNGSGNDINNIISDVTDFLIDNPVITFAFGGLIVLTLAFILIRRRGGKKRSRRRR